MRLAVGAALALAACSGRDEEAAATTDSAAVAARSAALDSLERHVAEIAQEVRGSVGFAAVHVESGARLAHNGGERYAMQSVYKAPIAYSVLRLVDSGALRLDSVVTVTPAEFAPNHSPLRDGARGAPVSVSVDSLLLLMIAESDNTASDVLLELAGGPQAVTRNVRAIGIDGLRVDRSERELGSTPYSDTDPRDTATPDAMADLLVAIQNGRGLSRDSRHRLLEIMARTRTGPHRIRGLLPPGTVVAHKTGTAGPMTNDAGLVTLPGKAGHVAIVVFVRSASDSGPKKERVIAEVARAVYDHFASGGASGSATSPEPDPAKTRATD